MWIKIKRVILFLIATIVTLLGLSVFFSTVFGYYGTDVVVILVCLVSGILLTALGIFIGRVSIYGTDKDVSDADLL